MTSRAQRVLISEPPFGDYDRIAAGHKPYFPVDGWPCRWIVCADAGEPPFVTAFRCAFVAPREETVRVHASGDERYELFLDGRRVGRGPEQSYRHGWAFESYDLFLPIGEHVLVARTWSGGGRWAQIAVAPGFLDDEAEQT